MKQLVAMTMLLSAVLFVSADEEKKNEKTYDDCLVYEKVETEDTKLFLYCSEEDKGSFAFTIDKSEAHSSGRGGNLCFYVDGENQYLGKSLSAWIKYEFRKNDKKLQKDETRFLFNNYKDTLMKRHRAWGKMLDKIGESEELLFEIEHPDTNETWQQTRFSFDGVDEAVADFKARYKKWYEEKEAEKEKENEFWN